MRRFPTIRELDDDAGRFLIAQSSSQALREAFAAAAETKLIENTYAALLNGVLDAGDRGGFVGGKAGRRGILSARNLVLAAAALVVNGVWGGAVSEYAGHSIVSRRAGAMLVRAEDAILDIASQMPADVRMAIRQVLERNRPAEPPPSPGQQQHE